MAFTVVQIDGSGAHNDVSYTDDDTYAVGDGGALTVEVHRDNMVTVLRWSPLAWHTLREEPKEARSNTMYTA